MSQKNTGRSGAAEISAWFQRHIAALVAIAPEEVEIDADFDSFGLDSVQGVDMITALEQWLGVEEDLPIDVIFDSASIREAAERVADHLAEAPAASRAAE